MSLRVAVAAPFQQAGADRVRENEFVVALSLDRDWMSPDQAKRLIDIGTGEGLLRREDDQVIATFDPGTVTVPDGFAPDPSIFQQRTPFERVLDDLVEAGVEKREAVAEINELQDELAITVEAAAVMVARRHGLEVADVAAAAIDGLRQ